MNQGFKRRSVITCIDDDGEGTHMNIPRLVEQAISGFAQGAATTMVGYLIYYGNHLSLDVPKIPWIPNGGQDKEQTPI